MATWWRLQCNIHAETFVSPTTPWLASTFVWISNMQVKRSTHITKPLLEVCVTKAQWRKMHGLYVSKTPAWEGYSQQLAGSHQWEGLLMLQCMLQLLVLPSHSQPLVLWPAFSCKKTISQKCEETTIAFKCAKWKPTLFFNQLKFSFLWVFTADFFGHHCPLNKIVDIGCCRGKPKPPSTYHNGVLWKAIPKL